MLPHKRTNMYFRVRRGIEKLLNLLKSYNKAITALWRYRRHEGD